MGLGMPVRHLGQTEKSLELRQEIWAGDKLGSVSLIEGI